MLLQCGVWATPAEGAPARAQIMAKAIVGKLETTPVGGAYVPVDAAFKAAPQEDFSGLPLGERLRKTRLNSGWTLDSASARTCIKRDYLEALETMDPRGLPSRAYAVGYLRTYASFLGLDAASCVAQFKDEVECDSGRAEPTAPEKRREIKLPRGTFGTILILAGVVAAAGWYGNYLTRTQALAESGAPIAAVMGAEAPLVAMDARAAVQPRNIWSGLPDPRSAGALVLEAGANVWLEVRDASGRILVSRQLEAGEIYRAPDEPGLVLASSDAGAILVRAAGRPLGPLGANGEAVDNVSASEFVLTALRETGAGTP